MPAVLEGVERRTVLATIFLDVLVAEEIDLSGQVTRFPVEDGTEISDNITIESERIRLSGNVSLADAAAIESGIGARAGSKMVDVVESLRKLRKDRALVTCSTGQMVYQDFAFESLRATRSNDGSGGNWLSIEAELVKVTKVQLQTAEVPERAQGETAGRAGETGKSAGKNGTAGRSGGNANRASGSGSEPQRKSLAAGGYDMTKDKLKSTDQYLRGLGRNMGAVPAP